MRSSGIAPRLSGLARLDDDVEQLRHGEKRADSAYALNAAARALAVASDVRAGPAQRATDEAAKASLRAAAASEGDPGARLREACSINKSLSALGNVINALCEKLVQLRRRESELELDTADMQLQYVVYRQKNMDLNCTLDFRQFPADVQYLPIMSAGGGDNIFVDVLADDGSVSATERVRAGASGAGAARRRRVLGPRGTRRWPCD